MPLLITAATAQNTLLITDFGAVANDDADDTSAIQAAIASALPGDTVLIPAGTFNVSASIIMGGTQVVLAGVGQNESVLKPYAGGPTFINPIVLSGNSNTVRDFAINGNNTVGFANGIYVGGTGATMDRMTIRDLNTFGFQHGIYALTADNVTISNSTFENIHVNSFWGAAIRYQSGIGVQIFNNTIRNTGRGGIFVNELAGRGSTDIVIRDNLIENSGLAPDGISMAIELGPYTKRAVVENNTVDHWISVGPIADQVAVRRNTIGDSRYTISYGLEAAGGTTNLVFSDNVVTGGVQQGLLIANTNAKDRMLIRNNVFEGASEAGILVQGDAPPINRTYFYQNQIANNGVGGVRVLREVNHVTFDSNVIQNNSSHGIILSGNQLDAFSFVNNQILNNTGWSVSGNVTGPNLEWASNTVAGNGLNRNLTSKGFTTNAQPSLSFTSEVDGIASSTFFVGDAVKFTPFFSDPNVGDSMSAILWDFDFGYPLSTISPTVMFTQAGDYRVTALAWDQAGRGVLAEHVISILSPPAPILGDFDGNGVVDGQDFLVWQRDPEVGDLMDWVENFGVGANGQESLTATPESTSAILLLIGLAATPATFRGRAQR
ncbi:MAG TPA: right-handed parallel beta-helix repeat-containing protein [Lacipirellulaceae bacterium]|nr:right-handed parallel beta-helix repeat-containing protein [Lacipirellulaceae bacterium]